MASQPPSVAQSKGHLNGVSAPGTRIPPEEQFWQHYSPHHEAPLSGIGSFAMHFLVIGFLIVAGYLGWLGLGTNRKTPDNDVVLLPSGGGGVRDGSEESATNRGKNQEVADLSKSQENASSDMPKTERTDLKEVNGVPPDTTPETHDDSNRRLVNEAANAAESLDKLNKDIQSKFSPQPTPPAAGKGGPGSGGGKGAGNGKGIGDGRAEGSGRIMTQREKRMLRWNMKLHPGNGNDYLRELDGLGAILAFPKERGSRDYLIIRDLRSRPAKALEEDIYQIPLINWRDDKPESVAELTRALGLRQRPDHFLALMPRELEEKLFEAELNYKGLTEDQILETTFQVRVGHDGKYYPEVIDQVKKN